MSISNPITDMLTCTRNARVVGEASVVMPSPKLKMAIAKTLRDEGYIDELAVTEQGGRFTLTIGLKHYAGRPAIERLGCVSKPDPRVYKGRNEIPQVMNGPGVAIISTPQGLTTDRHAYITGVGNEAIRRVA